MRFKSYKISKASCNKKLKQEPEFVYIHPMEMK